MRLVGTAVAVSSLFGAAVGLHADQLAWISRAQAEAAVAKLPAGSVVVAYCSGCDERPQVWSVERASAVRASDGEHFEVRIDGRRLSRARDLVKRGAYREPLEYLSVTPRRIRKEVDLAYLYVHEAGDRYRVLADVLKLPAEVAVHSLTVPGSATVARTTPREGLAVALYISSVAGREPHDSAEDIRKHVAAKRAAAFALVEDPDDAEVRLVILQRGITKGQGTDLNGQAAIKDFYRISGRVSLLEDSEPLEASSEFTSFAPWTDAAKAYTSQLESLVEQRLPEILQDRVGFPMLGGRIAEMDDRWRERLGVRKAKGGAFVTVEPGGPAAAAGIQPGDVIVEIDGKKTKHAWDVARIVWERGPGARLQLKLKRENAERHAVLTAGG